MGEPGGRSQSRNSSRERKAVGGGALQGVGGPGRLGVGGGSPQSRYSLEDDRGMWEETSRDHPSLPGVTAVPLVEVGSLQWGCGAVGGRKVKSLYEYTQGAKNLVH